MRDEVYTQLLSDLTKLTQGYWQAETYNSHRREDCRVWGGFDTKELAEQAASEYADSTNDTACDASAVFVSDFIGSGEDVRNWALQMIEEIQKP